MSVKYSKDCVRKNLLNNDLSIKDFTLYCLKDKCNRYFVAVYILTDYVVQCDLKYYETTVMLGDIDYLDVEERCFSKLEAYKQHKKFYKKLMNGFFDNEILRKIREAENVMKNDCP